MAQSIKIQFNDEVLNYYYYNRPNPVYPCFSVQIRFENGYEEELESFHITNKENLIDYIEYNLQDYINDNFNDDENLIDEVFINYEYIGSYTVKYELIDTLYTRY